MRFKLAAAAVAAALTAALLPAAAASASGGSLSGVNHIVVIYEENHSFDNLFGGWGSVNGQPVNGLTSSVLAAAHNQQVGQDGTHYTCLKQTDVNLNNSTNPAVPAPTCNDTTHTGANGPVSSSFTNDPFDINTYIPATATTCSKTNGFGDVPIGTGNPGGCTADIVHRFYQEQFQIHGGLQDRYVQGSDAGGLTMGYYETQNLPIYQYLNATGPYAGSTPPNYSVLDNFFQGGFGGSFLNHQVLVSAQAPIFANADKSGVQTGCSAGTLNCDLHSAVDANGFPNYTYPYYTPASTVKDNQLTEASTSGACSATQYSGTTTAPAGTLCGDYAINTIQPYTQPYSPGTALGKRLPNLTNDNIGDEMSSAGVSWGWYSGGWANAAGLNGSDATHPLSAGWSAGAGPTCGNANHNASAVFPYCPDALFQFHHQAFGYYANYADGTAGRAAHLKDELDLVNEPDASNPSDNSAYSMHSALPQVSFIKPIGAENEHPGYASDNAGQVHLVKLLQALLGPTNPDASSTMVEVTYDEFGGQYDHVAPPGTPANPGPHDAFGPGTRIPALVISPQLPQSGVDSTTHDTVSILSTIEERFGVHSIVPEQGSQVTTLRDTTSASLSSVFAPAAGAPEAPLSILLPLAGVAVVAGALYWRRRRHSVLERA